MKLRVQYSAQLRAAAGRSEEELDLPEPISLAELLMNLAAQRGQDVARHLFTAAGTIQPSLLLAVNGLALSAGDANVRALQPGDVVLLMPPIAGG